MLALGAARRVAEYATRIDGLEGQPAGDQRVEHAVERHPVGIRQPRLDIGMTERLGRGLQHFEHAHPPRCHLDAGGAQEISGRRHVWHVTTTRQFLQQCCICNSVVFEYRPMSALPLLLPIALACLLGGLLSLLAAALVMFGLSKQWLNYAVSFSIGMLLATSMLHLLPEALELGLTPHEVFPVLLGGILAFFALEKFAIWRHAHGNDAHAGSEACEDHTHDHHHAGGEAVSILVGDGFHNFTDGLLIAAAFLADPVLGWTTTLAVIAHEVPQEAGDFAILLAAGWRRAKALFWNGVSSLASLVGGLVGYFALERAQEWVPYILTLTAASFTYIAIADLMPRLKREQQGIGWHGLLLAAGIAVVVFGSGHSH